MDNIVHLITVHLKSKDIFENKNCPWVIEESKISGRGLFATRDIQPGEIILKDNPLLVGPRSIRACPPVCVNCYTKDHLHPCSRKCGLPVCSEKCENSTVHKKECEIISRWKNGHNFSNINLLLLKCLTPLRALLLNQDQMELLKLLQADPLHGIEVDVMKEKLQLNVSKEEENLMRLACSVLDVNAFEVTVGNTKDNTSLRGLYPLSCLMNHCCVPNTMHIFDCNQNMIIKSSTSIQKGEEIFDTYTRISWGTYVRRPHLMTTKKFLCCCPRCEDPTEFGTNLSAINCSNCQGIVLPYSRVGVKFAWKCSACNEPMPSEQAGLIHSTFLASLSRFSSSDTDPQDILRFLKQKLLKHLPACSQIAMQLKYRLVWILGHHEKYVWRDLSEELLNEKESICREMLEFLQKLRAGKNKMKGLVLYELYCCLREQQRRLKLREIDNVNETVFEEQSKEMETLFEESREILEDDIHAPAEIKEHNSVHKDKSMQNEELILAG